MLLALQHAAELPPIVREELEQLIAGIQTAFNSIDITGAIQSAINTSAIRRYTFAQASVLTLGSTDTGVLAFISDYGHLLRWTGSVWEFAPGDVGNNFIEMKLAAPQEVGWQLCNGTATNYLTVGAATLSVTAVTPPNLTGTPSYLKTAAAYTGSLIAAAVSGRTGTVSDTGGGNDMDIFGFNAAAGGTNVISGASKFTHNHDAGTLAADVAHLNMLPYYRR